MQLLALPWELTSAHRWVHQSRQRSSDLKWEPPSVPPSAHQWEPPSVHQLEPPSVHLWERQ